ncbi:protein of unknown function [Methylococcus capsulatus]|uniref:Uncharacterized protein n=1 Tax=Methylococcus capsulatus TaxID=414 RepID=A0AA35Y184_METCP|nr:protein of unknown function [Methylococcus capsulatus]
MRDPRKPEAPALAHESALPFLSVMVIMVLLKDALICAIPSEISLLTLFTGRPVVAIVLPYLYFLIGRRGPFRVRALVRVRCPRTGKPRLCLMPR